MSQEYDEALQGSPSVVPPSAVPPSAVPVSVVVEEELSPEPPLSAQPITRISDNNRIENEKRNEKVSFRTLLGSTINLPIFSSFKQETQMRYSALISANIELLTNQKH